MFAAFAVSPANGEPTLPSQPPSKGSSTEASYHWAAHIREASKRFAIPERWIRAVIYVESANDMKAISPKDAMGLMQIMPSTWRELRQKHRLGDDPFLPRDNILAGTAYLREMLDRFGRRGFLAAYNAGPARYQEHLATGRPLPAETVDYVRKLTTLIDGSEPVPSKARKSADRSDARRSSIFVQSVSGRNAAREYVGRTAEKMPSDTVFPVTGTPDTSSSQSATVTDLTAIEPPLNRPSNNARATTDSGRDGLFPLR